MSTVPVAEEKEIVKDVEAAPEKAFSKTSEFIPTAEPTTSRRDRTRTPSDMFEKVVFVNRCAKVVKGGRRFSFSALLVVGDNKGKVGVGFGKAREVAEAIRKATENAKKNLHHYHIGPSTIPHEVTGAFGGGKVLLRPASLGTGLIAGGGVRAVLEAAGVKDILAKSMGSSNPANVVKATVDALSRLRTRSQILETRGKKRPEKGKDA
ncbi:MAG: 30S ribosomal protein S5 [Verrucomicrobia bacterium]|jgi:small subunit ribosomal protein S5|nr:30S ribosomal protein S5 [Verrucomicrobiota bacterium]